MNDAQRRKAAEIIGSWRADPTPDPDQVEASNLVLRRFGAQEHIEDALEAPGLRRLSDAALAEDGDLIPVDQALNMALISDDNARSLEQAPIQTTPAVFTYLTTHLALVPLLPEAITQIRAHFGPAPLFLEVYTDPEVAGWETLHLVISPLCSPAEAVDRYHQLWEGYWRHAFDWERKDLAIIVEYRQ